MGFRFGHSLKGLALKGLVRMLGSDKVVDGDEYAGAIEAVVDDLAPQLSEYTPQQAYEIAEEQVPDHPGVAMGVRFRVWEIQLARLENEAFERHAEDVEENEPMWVDYSRKMVSIDSERERRGLPLPALPSFEEAYTEYRRLNLVIASFDFTDEDRIQHSRADAHLKMIRGRDERNAAPAT